MALISHPIRPATWTASTCRRPPAEWTRRAACETGLDDPGFVVGGHDRHEHWAPERSQALFERRKVDLTIPAHRQTLDASSGEPTAREHRGMLDRGG
jgi:hypothetical protein